MDAAFRERERQRAMQKLDIKRKEREGPPLRLLSLDGGGIKGYSTLLLLQEVMYRLYIEIEGKPPGMNDIYKPCDHFDLIGGVGTGGLIAIMLGRLRMPIETVKTVWVQMSKRVFETDKTIAGIPLKKTLFKASLLESATKEIVREYTKFDEEDISIRPPSRASTLKKEDEIIPNKPQLNDEKDEYAEDTRIKYQATQLEQLRPTTSGSLSVRIGHRVGNADALLYDPRPELCKTFVTAMYQHSTEDTPPCLLRSYLSQKTLNTEPETKIWEAARATSANLAAFKPIQINQTVFLDEGHGSYNVTPTLLEEALENEWPGRAVGCLVSIGTGKPPRRVQGSHAWWESLLTGPFDNFAEAKRRLITKTAAAEDIHQRLTEKDGCLSKYGVPVDHYIRLNVEIGVGEFGMNDWTRLSDISTNTRRYLGSEEGKRFVGEAAQRLAIAYRIRHLPPPKTNPSPPPPVVELPASPRPPHDPQPLPKAHARKRSMDDRPPSSNRHIASQLQRSRSYQHGNILPVPPKDANRPHNIAPIDTLRAQSRRMTAPPTTPPPTGPLPNPPYPID